MNTWGTRASSSTPRMRLLDTQPQYLAGLDRVEGLSEFRHQGHERPEPITWCLERDDRDRWWDRLLRCQKPIDRDEDIVLPRCSLQKLAVSHPSPATLGDGRNLVPLQLLGEPTGQTLIEQNPHCPPTLRVRSPALRWPDLGLP